MLNLHACGVQHLLISTLPQLGFLLLQLFLCLELENGAFVHLLIEREGQTERPGNR